MLLNMILVYLLVLIVLWGTMLVAAATGNGTVASKSLLWSMIWMFLAPVVALIIVRAQ